MTRLPVDLGKRVHVLARLMPPEAVAELFAIRAANQYPTQCPIHGSHWSGPIYLPLMRLKLVKPEFMEGWPRGYRRPQITALGERVLLRVAELAMVETGRMASLDAEFEEVE